jgi:26S proteasome regulatory subunit N12
MVSESDLSHTLTQLSSLPHNSPQTASLLSKAKLSLLHLNALLPTSQTPPSLLVLARRTLETGALISIRNQDPDAFTRYYQQLQPFYDLPPSAYISHQQHSQHAHHGHNSHHHGHSHDSQKAPHADSEDHGQRSKVTGLYLLLLLTKGDYAGFHTLLEGLEYRDGAGLKGDKYIKYPVELEQWLMEGAYDSVWKAMKGEGGVMPSEEFGVFSDVSSCLFPWFCEKDVAGFGGKAGVGRLLLPLLLLFCFLLPVLFQFQKWDRSGTDGK